MKIVLIGYEANIKDRVGSNQYAYELMKALYELDQSNEYNILLPSFPLSDLPKERKNWRYQIIGPKRLWNIFGLPLVLFRQKQKPSVIFNPGHYSPIFVPSPLVISIMDLGYLHYPRQFTKPILAKLKFWTSISIKRAKAILAISKSTQNDIIRQYQVDPSKVQVTYLGYDQEKFNAKVKEQKIEIIKGKYNINGKYLLFLGTLKPNKNIERILEAFKELRDGSLKLVIAGRKGWLFKSIFEKVKELNLLDKVIFTDFVNENDLPALMTGAEVFILPSLWEGFGIPVLEAMACGTPVVVSDVGSLPEVAGEAGVLVNPTDVKDIAGGIKKAIEQRNDLIKKGYLQVKKFSWEKCARQTLEVLEEVGRKG